MEILSVIYLLIYAISGIFIARYVFASDKPIRRIFMGLVFGLMMLLWLPVLFAFLIDFTLLAQLLAAATSAIIALVFILLTNRKLKNGSITFETDRQEHLKSLLLTCIPIVLIGWILLANHTIVPASDGSLHSGQSTYGDTCMHLGFISSISVQEAFPPDYSLLPGTALGYPFLCDSISSTFYTLGSSLRFAALLPAMYAHLITVFGVFFFFESWFKKHTVSSLATWMFFVGGGLGFAYIFNNAKLLEAEGIDRWTEMLTGFYQTPTNLPAEGLRWVNSIADMIVPQRATLFGWALLFPCLQLLHRAVIQKETRLFLPLGIIAGSMPLVHTHSFLAVGLISVFLFVVTIRRTLLSGFKKSYERILVHAFLMFLMLAIAAFISMYVGESGYTQVGNYVMSALSVIFLFQIGYFTHIELKHAREEGQVSRLTIFSTLCLVMLVSIIGCMNIGSKDNTISLFGAVLPLISALVIGIGLALRLVLRLSANNGSRFQQIVFYFTKGNGRQLLMFIAFGVITVLLAAPQLFGFTFKQASTDQFVRWNFNWDNESDSWLWFYIKNLGLIFIFMLPAFLSTKKESKVFYGGALLIWLICEIMVFQPNRYDNNKLLFVWFAMTCGIVAEYLVTLYRKLLADANSSEQARCKRLSVRVVAAMVLVAIFLSGSLTLVREYVSGDHIGTYTNDAGEQKFGVVESGYEVVSANMVEAAEWVKENTEPTATFLTHNNHNNAIAMLTGRNIFVGAGTFLYYHGVDYMGREAMLKELYESPATSLDAAALEYDIDYVLISGYENGNYDVDMEWFMENLNCVYNQNSVYIFSIDND